MNFSDFIWHHEATFDPSQYLSSNLQCPTCGRSFTQSNAYSTHARTCRTGKKRIASSLDLVKENFKIKKARLNEPSDDHGVDVPGAMPPAMEVRIQDSYVNFVDWAYVSIRMPPPPLMLAKSRQPMTPCQSPVSGPVEIVDFHCAIETNNRRLCATCPLFSRYRHLTSQVLR